MTCNDTNVAHSIRLGNCLVKQPAARVLDSQSMATEYDPMPHGEEYSTQSAILSRKRKSSEAILAEQQANNGKRSVNVLEAVSGVENGAIQCD